MVNINLELFYEIANEIIETDVYQELKKYLHHGNVNIYEHSISVALLCYKKAFKSKKVNMVSLVRGALLHDFYLYDWHDKNKGFRFHGFKHPRIAYHNAIKYFEINKIERNMILSHMWPLGLTKFPRYKESWILFWCDKRSTWNDYFKKRHKSI